MSGVELDDWGKPFGVAEVPMFQKKMVYDGPIAPEVGEFRYVEEMQSEFFEGKDEYSAVKKAYDVIVTTRPKLQVSDLDKAYMDIFNEVHSLDETQDIMDIHSIIKDEDTQRVLGGEDAEVVAKDILERQ
jgi:hypothetical protein